MESPKHTYLIIGAGAFGTSTALHLALSEPNALITLIDTVPYINNQAASSDVNKIVRADYDSIAYMKLGLEALEEWKSNPTFQPWFHETGMMFSEDLDIGRKVCENYNSIGPGFAAKLITPAAARELFPLFKEANWEGVDEIFWNPHSGWGEADAALRSATEAAVKHGVTYVANAVSKLLFDEDGTCIGALTTTGESFMADSVILCAGARVPKILADSAPDRPEIHAGDRMVAAGAVSLAAQVPEERRAEFFKAPVLFNGLSHTQGESIPITPGGILKFNYEATFTNKVYHEASGQHISVPPERETQNTWSQDVPKTLKNEVRNVMQNTYGSKTKDLTEISYRMCWDAVTPNQDWVITPHPKSRNLYIAAGGSFHAWKFLPILGKYIVQMLQGRLEDELAQRWAWDRPQEGAACKVYIPKRDMMDIIQLDQADEG